jgi:hypothetical protein
MPETKEIVINTTPILSLIAETGSLDMLPLLYSRIWVPWEVCKEIQAGGANRFGGLRLGANGFQWAAIVES